MTPSVTSGKDVEPGDIEPYRDPVDQEEADRIRMELSADIRLIQSQLSDKSRAKGIPYGQYQYWRSRAILALNHKQDRIRRVKHWIKNTHELRESAQKNELLTESAGAAVLRAACSDSIRNLFLYARGLEEEVARLQTENTTLRNMLAAPEPEAPGEGVDEWREAGR